MKNIIVATFGLLITFSSFGQVNNSKWTFGIQAGVNALRISKIPEESSFSLFKSSNSERILVKERFNFQIRGVAKYDLNKRIKFITGVGVTRAKASAIRKLRTSKTNLWPILFGGYPTTSNTVKKDEVTLHYTMIDIPMAIRWQMVPEESTKYNFKMYLDLGFNMNIPLFSNSSAEVTYTDESETTHASQTLEIRRVSIFYCLGFVVGKNSSIEWRWQRMATQEDSEIYSSSLRTIALTRYF